MAYEWPRNLCNGQGVPYEKLPGVYLEKTDATGAVVGRDTFSTQEAVDAAWADGYHTPGKPATRDCMDGGGAIEVNAAPTEDPAVEEDPEEAEEEEGPTVYSCGDCEFTTASEHGLKVHRATKHKE